MSVVSIHWFRQDLRLGDNPAFERAARSGAILPIYILDDDAAGEWAMGGASRWWLHKALQSLNAQLGGRLRLYRGKATEIVPRLVTHYQANALSWSRCYEPWRMVRDSEIAKHVEEMGCETIRLNGSLLWEPWTIKKKDGGPYKVFTPYYRKGCLQSAAPAVPIAVPSELSFCSALEDDGSVSLDALDLLPEVPWHLSLEAHWDVSEDGAQKALAAFMDGGLGGYKAGRDFPSKFHMSRLSPYLHWGQISPNQVWHAANFAQDAGGLDVDVDHFRSELAWREFSYSLLYYNHDLPKRPLQAKFDGFDWREDFDALTAWQKGQTGIPIVDAGMRELWQTGYMHNRVRMIVASFLVKNLRFHWRHGEEWFWDTLVDADLAANSASWQWVAGCGADAAPYFRIFNPVLQAERFDPDGVYIRKYVPELAALPNKYLFKPWTAPKDILDRAGVQLGQSYPEPVVDLKQSREGALAAFKALS
ncbi:cryptochrome/photolyase family protein [Cohaesibacter celericrescens]|uniref:Deoxyribodipyrimidine photo-lyase n=1 Tax=Cohaesibacter celericrescens TaxID=2067669 RepID=A0A2N5XWD5_9HYPH|nr:deoxyribodipyrimidine photo-lyase [Cohaesibacter celericrescens]PLW78822.1 deoxyribodipyrimidine photolyase [Cohaesibacter celericrescens]